MSEHASSNLATSCPRQLFGLDLKLILEQKIREGHQLIIMGDFNSSYDELSSWMIEAGLLDVHEEKFGKGPATHSRSKGPAIDRVFASPHLRISRGGFLPYSKLMSDHKGIWFDIPKALLFGYNPPVSSTYSARRLKVEDPRVVKQYLNHLYTNMNKRNLFCRMESCHRATVYPLPPNIAHDYETIDDEVCKLMTEAEAQCRKIRAGAIKWSPAYQHASLTLEYWLKRR